MNDLSQFIFEPIGSLLELDRFNPIGIPERRNKLEPTGLFWDTPEFEKLAEQQGVAPIRKIEDLVGDFWPEDEDLDEFLAEVRRWRDEG